MDPITTNELLDALRAAGTPRTPHGEGWLRVNECAKQLGLERSATRARLAKLLAAGTAEHELCGGVSYWRFKRTVTP